MSKKEELIVSGVWVPDLGELKHNWGWLLGLGIVLMVLGTIGLGMTFALTLASIVFFGVLFLIGGGVQLVHAFKCKGWKSILWHVVIALVYIVAGAVVVMHPLLGASVLTLVVAWSFIAIGILRIMIAVQNRAVKYWIWSVIGGVLAVIIGIMIIAQWPASGLWVIGLFLAIELIIAGWSYIFLALAVRGIAKESGG
jgi:uncharacterized membrane protein HdeD (DUF308 family)